MYENGALSAADVAAVAGNRGMGGFGYGDGGIFWIFILFLFAMGGGGFGGFGGTNGALTRAEMQQGFDTAEITRKLDGMSYGIADSTFALNNTIMNEGRSIQSQLADCCCNTRLGIAELSAQNDRNTCTITTAIHAEGEATRALIRENEIQALRDKVQALELGNAMCGVVRYHNQMAYTTNCNPFGGTGCCNNNI